MVNIEAIVERVKAYLAKAQTDPNTAHIFKFQITQGGSVAKTFVINVKEKTVSHEDAPADVTVTVDEDTIKAIFAGELKVSEAIKQKKFHLEGDKAIGEKIQGIIEKIRASS